MAGTITHIVKRSGVFQYHRRVPQAVMARSAQFDALFGGRPVFRRSLRTKDQGEALLRAADVEKEFDRRVRQALGHLQRVDPPKRPVTPDFLIKVYEEQRLLTARPYAMVAVDREGSIEAEEEHERMLERLEQDAVDIRAALESNRPTVDPRLDVAAIADSVIAEHGVDAPLGSRNHSAIRKVVRDGILQGFHDASDYLLGRKAVLPLIGAPPRPSGCPRLSELVESYVHTLSKRRTRMEVQGALRNFVAAIGDLPIDEIKRSHVARFCEIEGAKRVGGRTKNSVERPMSSETLGKKVALLRAAVSLAIERCAYEGANPFSSMKVAAFTQRRSQAVTPDKRPFTVAELNRIFAYPWFTGCASARRIHALGDHRLTGMHYWVPVLALFTGCRAGELGGLMTNEVRIDDQYPHLIIRDNQFRTTKGAYRRNVPLLDQLIELGFDKFVEQARAEGRVRLFEDWKAPGGKLDSDDPAWSNGAIIRSFNTTLIPKALTGTLVPNARREVTFHGFRGAFKTLISSQRYGIEVNYRHEIVGHAKLAMDQRYIGEIPLDETYPAVRACRFEGLSIPPAP